MTHNPTIQRKIIQIAALRANKLDELGSLDETETELIALCNDGTVWTMFGTLNGSQWVPIAPIPQGEPSIETDDD